MLTWNTRGRQGTAEDIAALRREGLPVASYTEEDWSILCAATMRWWLRHRSPFPLGSLYVTTDRRDAERMLGWRRFRHLEWRVPLQEPSIEWLRDPSEPRWQPIGGQL